MSESDIIYYANAIGTIYINNKLYGGSTGPSQPVISYGATGTNITDPTYQASQGVINKLNETFLTMTGVIGETNNNVTYYVSLTTTITPPPKQ
jgi:hypothetical protein